MFRLWVWNAVRELVDKLHLTAPTTNEFMEFMRPQWARCEADLARVEADLAPQPYADLSDDEEDGEASADQQRAAGVAPDRLPKGIVGNPGFPLEAWKLARKLRTEHQDWRWWQVRKECSKTFKPNEANFGRWARRERRQ